MNAQRRALDCAVVVVVVFVKLVLDAVVRFLKASTISKCGIVAFGPIIYDARKLLAFSYAATKPIRVSSDDIGPVNDNPNGILGATAIDSRRLGSIGVSSA
jgi:hypothetical protein